MKLSTAITVAKSMQKKLLASLLVTTLALSSVGGFATAQNQVRWEGWTKSLNATNGETQYKDVTNAKVDEVVQVQLWHHNRENPAGTQAQNTRVKFTVPSGQGKTHTITGTSSADNAPTITDTTTINTTLDRNKLDYIEGSAKFRYNKGAAEGDKSCQTGFEYPPERCYATVSISDEVVNSGVNLDAIRGGKLRGCNAFHETVTIQVRVKADVVSVNKYVRHAGEGADDWETSTEAKPGDDLEYKIRFKNEGNTQLDDVVVGDNLPKYHEYISGSTKLYNGNHPDGMNISSDNIHQGGINVGNYGVGSVGYVIIRVKLADENAFEKCGVHDLRNVGIVRPKDMVDHYNTAQVLVKVKCKPGQEEVPPTPGQPTPSQPGQPGQPTSLPVTGPADTAVIFIVVSAASGLAYRVFVRRFYGEV